MRRSPVLALSLFAGWLLLAGSASPGHLLLAAVLAVALTAVGARLAPPLPGLRRPDACLRLMARVGIDILRSNLAVAGRVLSARPPRGCFVRVPLRLADPRAVALLAGIVTLTPGTLSVDVEGGALWVHALHLDGDPQSVADEIRDRYESLLLEIFR